MGADPKQLERPPWSALSTTHSSFALGDDLARRYPPDVSPLAAVREVSPACMRALSALMKPGDAVGLFGAGPIAASGDLITIDLKTVEQMVHDAVNTTPANGEHVNLTATDVPEMMRLVELTKPGPFETRTIALGGYIGIRSGDRLVAMAGERMRFDGFAEISAVCTHPDHAGRGYASSLVRSLVRSILDRGETPFLHIFSVNTRAAALYKKLGFSHQRSLTVTVLRRPDEQKRSKN